ncbi:hypothetical protein D3C86_915370 [compost metagenome]
MNKVLIAAGGLAIAVGLGAFVADLRNQAALRLVVNNMAAEKPVMQGVVFKVPFLKDPPPKKAYHGLYPEHFTWGTDAVLKYYDLGEGYWQTPGINLVNGRSVENEADEWQAHFRFKFNPPSDPLHPGHTLVAIDSPQHALSFAPLGPVDFDAVRTIPADKWLKRNESERAAVWNLKAGDVVGIKIDAVSLAEPERATGSAKPATPKRHAFVAKVRLKKLSHATVRFDFVYRNDGKLDFPAPNYPEAGAKH